jgi:hypothetical protein
MALGLLLVVILVGSQDVQHSARYEPAFYLLATVMIGSGLGYAVFSYALAIRRSSHPEATARKSRSRSNTPGVVIAIGVVASVANVSAIAISGHANPLQLALGTLILIALVLVNRRWPQ